MDAICREPSQLEAQHPLATGRRGLAYDRSVGAFVTYLRYSVPSIDHEVAQIRALRPPPSLKRDHHEILLSVEGLDLIFHQQLAFFDGHHDPSAVVRSSRWRSRLVVWQREIDGIANAQQALKRRLQVC